MRGLRSMLSRCKTSSDIKHVLLRFRAPRFEALQQYQKAAAQLASRAAAAGQKEAGFSSLYYGNGKKG